MSMIFILILLIVTLSMLILLALGYRCMQKMFGHFETEMVPGQVPPRFHKNPSACRQAMAYLAEQKKHEKVLTLTAGDGVRLQGYYYQNPDAQRLLICAHGYHSSPFQDFLLPFRFFYENGCSLLLIDERAHNRSEGRYSTFGVKEAEDLAGWTCMASEMPENRNLPIYLTGQSMGSSIVLMALSKKLPERVEGVIADCGFANAIGELKASFRILYHLPAFPLLTLTFFWLRLLGHVSLKHDNPEETLKANDRYRILFFHGTADWLVMPSQTIRNYMACPQMSTLCMIDGASHCRAYETDPEAYEKAVKTFWEQV